jgi:hypothetical protein
MKRFLPFVASAFGWLVCSGSPALADPIPAPNAQWSYNFTPNVPQNQVTADPRSDGGTPGGVNLTNEPTKFATGSSDVVVTNIRAFSAALPTSPDTFGPSSGNWSEGLVLTDVASGQSSNLTFTGKFNGAISGGDPTHNIGGNSNITTTLDPQTQSVTLGNNTYTVSLTSYTPPGPPGASNGGSISAHVTVTTSGSGIGIAAVPEPSSMVLSGLGLSLAGLAAWRKRRQRRLLAIA